MAHAFTVPDAAAEKLLRLVAGASGVQHLNITVNGGGSEVQFTSADGHKASGAHTACRYLVSLGGTAAQLLGDSPEHQAKVGGAG